MSQTSQNDVKPKKISNIQELPDDVLKLILNCLDIYDMIYTARACKLLNNLSKRITQNYEELLYIGKVIRIKHCNLNKWGIGVISKRDKSNNKQVRVYILAENIKVWVDISLDYQQEWMWIK